MNTRNLRDLREMRALTGRLTGTAGVRPYTIDAMTHGGFDAYHGILVGCLLIIV